MAFSAGAVIGVAFFDLAPEALEAGKGLYRRRARCSPSRRWASSSTRCWTGWWRAMTAKARPIPARGLMGAASFSAHSVMDGFAMGMAFQTGHAIGLVVAAAVLAHDFADGLNTVNVVTNNGGSRRFALRWLAVDAVAPVGGRGLEPADSFQRRRAGGAAGAVLPASSCTSAPAVCCRKASAQGRGYRRRLRRCWAPRSCMP